MYQLIIADDEKIIRQGLKNVVNWEELGFEVTQIFTDGQEIIEYLEYMMPDVILTDIKMSHVSGLEVAKYVFEQELPCKVVLISGHQEFELALQGIKYGAEDYLLKPTNVENISETFQKIKQQLDETSKKQLQEQAEKKRMEEAIPLLEERFFSDLILGVVEGEEYIRNRMSLLYPNVDIEKSYCLVVDIQIEEYEYFMNQVWEYSYDQLEVNLHNFLRIYQKGISFHFVYKSGKLLELFGMVTHSILPGEVEEFCKKGVEELLQELKGQFGFMATYHIRQIYHHIYEIGGLRESVFLQVHSEESLNSYIQEQKKLLMSNITLGNMVTAQKLFHHILEELKEVPARYRNNQIIEIFSTMNTVIAEVNQKLASSLQNYFQYSAILTMSTQEEVKNYCDRVFDRMRLAEEKKEYYDANSLISKAKSYITTNLNRDISQEEVANQLYICSAYLSRLFKKQTGENFSQYVTRLKMERAIELLREPKYKTYQVSEALGYKTPRYFARLFRSHTGMNPSEYRSKVLLIGGEIDENEG